MAVTAGLFHAADPGNRAVSEPRRGHMKAVVWHGSEKLSVDDVDEPKLEQPTDAIVRITSTAICGSDLHLYGGKTPGMKDGDILGHEPMGIVEEVGAEVKDIAPGDRVVIPFNISCGHCFMCDQELYSQCETTQNREFDKGASLFGYTHMYGGVPGGQAEFLRVPCAHFGPVKVPEDGPDERYLFLSDVLPTAWQSVIYADVPDRARTVAVFGLGPIGQMAARIAKHLGAERVIALDIVPERLAMAERHGIEAHDASEMDVADDLRELTGGRGPDAVIEAVGLESEGNWFAHAAQYLKVKPDRHRALHDAIWSVRRGGTLSIIGVYGGPDPMWPLGEMFDRQIQVRMGQANVRRWTDDILPLLTDNDPLGVMDLTTHRMPLAQAPEGYDMFREKRDGCVKVVLEP
jgi:threonine dehydrogenase-like Zn-dependent dehydrogenase